MGNPCTYRLSRAIRVAMPACVLLGFAVLLLPVRARAQRIEFNREIRPILSENCFACHGPDKNQRKAGLRLDDRDAAYQRAIVTGHPERSLLVQRITAANPSRLMPPPASGKKLTAAQRDLLVRWIKQGAQYQLHWAYMPIKRPVPPAPLKGGSWARNPIDRFILAKLMQKGLTPSPEADRRTLIRRVYLDLTGIPPTPMEVTDFLSDKSPNAYDKIVDRLLASPRYGERMATGWLDIVRYADTVGYHGDQNMNSWPYRDYVINSFNADKPFDQFTREQIAGDLLPNPTLEMLTATCFNRLNMVTREGGAQPKEYLAKYAGDRVRTVSMAFLGSTMGCCECHNHKYDPFSQKDFYSLAAFFADVKQWGVYEDYSYTPEPELAGIDNDGPFPPEIKVESAWLKQRIVQDRTQIHELAMRNAPREQRDTDAFRAWVQAASEFVAHHPDGWETPPLVPPAVKEGAKPAELQLGDGSVLINSKAPASVDLLVTPSAPYLASVRLSLLPHADYKGSIVRAGNGGTLVVALSVKRADGKTKALGVRHASASAYEPRYANGFELVGIQRGWRLPPARLKETLDSVWVLDTPVKLAPGDKVQVSLRTARPGCVRVSLSPFAPDDPGALSLPATLKSLEPMPAAAAAVRNVPDPISRPEFLESFLRGTGWNSAAFGQLKQIEQDALECRRGMTPVMVVQSATPKTVRVLPRGNWQDESGPIVEPAVPHFLPQAGLPADRRLTRLDLANWIVSPENPLTSRMFVNRLWKQFFGAAFSDKVEDLGTQGEWPSHPELLDWLAWGFMTGEYGSMGGMGSNSHTSHTPWSVKALVRMIVTSATYRQSSKLRPEVLKLDPGNRLLASQNPRRMEAEQVRDNALAIASLLNTEVGGPPVHPYQPAGYYVNLQFPDRDWVPEKDGRQWRRAVYMHWQRTFLHPMLANFDAPSREDCIAQRTLANTPQQALTLLNDPEFIEAARAFAARLLEPSPPGPLSQEQERGSKGASTDAQRLERAYELALCRPIKPAESKSLLAFLAKVRADFQAGKDDAGKLQSVGFAPATPETPDAAAWTTVCRVILNLHETITRY